MELQGSLCFDFLEKEVEYSAFPSLAGLVNSIPSSQQRFIPTLVFRYLLGKARERLSHPREHRETVTRVMKMPLFGRLFYPGLKV